MSFQNSPQLLPILCYPSLNDESLQARLKELESLHIHQLLNVGTRQVQGLNILGKGYCGLVTLAQHNQRYSSNSRPSNNLSHVVALKIRRTDAPKETFEQEAKAMTIANHLNIGPILFAHSPNFIVMEYLPGQTLFQQLQQEGSKLPIRKILRSLLTQCFQLDQQELDHGNLRCVTEHVFLRDQHPVIIDFSSSSCDRRPANLTTLIQGLFWGTQFAVALNSKYPVPDRSTLIPLLQSYKQNHTIDSFQDILETLGLASTAPVDCQSTYSWA